MPATFDPVRWTRKTQEAVQSAMAAAADASQPEVTPDHPLAALLGQAEAVVLPLLEKAGVPLPPLRNQVDHALSRLPRSYGSVDFTNAVLILTSNLPGDPAAFFKPEFINRIDEIVRFRALTQDDLAQVFEIQLHQLEARLAERRLTLSVSEEARRWLAQRGYDPDYGARPLKRLIQHTIVDPLALELLSGVYRDGDTVTVDVAGDELVLK